MKPLLNLKSFFEIVLPQIICSNAQHIKSDCGLSKALKENNCQTMKMTLTDSTNDTNIRIINGIDATIEEFPWISSIFVRNRGYCGGVIIDKYWILSVAHCFYP